MNDSLVVRGIEWPCPGCGRSLPAGARIVVDLERSPELREEAEMGRLNRLCCPHCAAEFIAPIPLLVCDPGVPRALAYVPAHLADEADSIVSGLLVRWSQANGGRVPADYLLEPTICDDPDEFQSALAGRPPATGSLHPHWETALAFVRRHGSPRLWRALSALTDVTDLPELVAALNQTPDLIEPVVVAELEQVAGLAEADGEEQIAEPLYDLAAMLRLHTPALAGDDSEDEPIPEDVRVRLAAADLEAAAEYLERPARESGDEAKRAMQNTLEPELREGFTEHAQLFGGMVQSMMEHDTDGTDEPPASDDEAPEGVAELIEAPTLDRAMELIVARPSLISPAAVEYLRGLEAAALDAGDDGLAQHLDTLINTIYIAAADEGERDGEASDELDRS